MHDRRLTWVRGRVRVRVRGRVRGRGRGRVRGRGSASHLLKRVSRKRWLTSSWLGSTW